MSDEPIHEWFGLSYTNYLVVPRSVLQSMPIDCQQRLVECLNEMAEIFDHNVFERNGCEYRVQLVDNQSGKFTADSLADYERGRRRVKPHKTI